MKNSKYILFIYLFFSCEDVEIPRYELEVNPRLEQDQNGFYHLKLKRDNVQTLHRLNLSITKSNEPIENIFTEWSSNLYAILNDTLGYIVNQNLNDMGSYTTTDTSYLIGFNGLEVPTINCCSYSNPGGQINTMIGLWPQMVGDTMLVSFSILDINQSIEIVLD